MNKPLSLPAAQPPIHFRVEVANALAHLFRVTLTIAQPAASQRVALPVWIPGSYLIREFAKNLQHLTARQGARTAVPVQQLDKNTWQIDCNPTKPLVLSYEVYARDNSVRTAWLDTERGFFNGTSLCLRVEGQEGQRQALEILPPKGHADWSLATGLTAQKVDKNGFGTYGAADYDELVDCPVEIGMFWRGSFTACGVPHQFVVTGAWPTFDGARLLADTQKICEEEIRFWHGSKKPPFKNYLFMLNAVDDGYGGLEHRNSTALICNRKDLPREGEAKVSEGYTTLRGLISHEYFHTWNVKRLRPAEFARYQYDRENYTELLWFFEGFTSYYDDLLLRRAGLLDNAAYLRLLNKTINQVQQAPGRLVQSVAQASFDAWVKYYRQDDNTANATISYYTKGALVALCLDLTLRAEGHTTLDDVMRGVWARCHLDGGDGPMREADLACVLEALGHRSFAPELALWVHSTQELPLQSLLAAHGVAVHEDPSQLAQRLGLRVTESAGVLIKTVLRGSAAEKAGFAAGDEWLAVSLPKSKGSGWRMSRLDDLTDVAGSAKKVTALISRDKRLMQLSLTMSAVSTTWRLAIQDSAKIDQWLRPTA
ncbi:MAG: M61 family metallopeptidase [Polaromonas sp.]|nr:M61 family metallopeptidase [Polaromonas sp.]